MTSRSLSHLTPEQLELLAAKLAKKRAVAVEEPRCEPFVVTPDEHALFVHASHDRNPLHVSEAHARRTPFGERVVFGCLSGLACLGRLRARPERHLSSLRLEFLAPLTIGLACAVDLLDDAPERARAELRDGQRRLLRLSAEFDAGAAPSARCAVPAQGTACAVRAEPAERTRAELAPGREIEGLYSPSWEHLHALAARLSLAQAGVTPVQVAAVTLCSYLVGMELPGFWAMFSDVSLRFAPGPLPADVRHLAYRARVEGFDEELSLLTFRVTMSVEGSPLAEGTFRAFVRSAAPETDLGVLEASLPRGERLRGKVALVTGASRGLGATVARALALQGCTVFASFHRSRDEAARVRESVIGASGEIHLLQGDAGDLGHCAEMKAAIAGAHGRLDFLIANACPALQPLPLEPETFARVAAYVSGSVALASAPMATFLGLLSAASGFNVVVSSQEVSTTSADFPHYVGAKCAIEGIARAAAAKHRSVSTLLVRPPRLLTDLVNTPSSRLGALPTERVAVKLVQRLLGAPSPGHVELLEDFT